MSSTPSEREPDPGLDDHRLGEVGGTTPRRPRSRRALEAEILTALGCPTSPGASEPGPASHADTGVQQGENDAATACNESLDTITEIAPQPSPHWPMSSRIVIDPLTAPLSEVEARSDLSTSEARADGSPAPMAPDPEAPVSALVEAAPEPAPMSARAPEAPPTPEAAPKEEATLEPESDTEDMSNSAREQDADSAERPRAKTAPGPAAIDVFAALRAKTPGTVSGSTPETTGTTDAPEALTTPPAEDAASPAPRDAVVLAALHETLPTEKSSRRNRRGDRRRPGKTQTPAAQTPQAPSAAPSEEASVLDPLRRQIAPGTSPVAPATPVVDAPAPSPASVFESTPLKDVPSANSPPGSSVSEVSPAGGATSAPPSHDRPLFDDVAPRQAAVLTTPEAATVSPTRPATPAVARETSRETEPDLHAPARVADVPPAPPTRPRPAAPAPAPAPNPGRAQEGAQRTAVVERIEFPRRRSAQHVLTVLLLAAVAGLCVTGWIAWQEPTTASIVVAACLGVVTIAMWSARSQAAPATLVVDQGVLQITRHDTRNVFDLTSGYTPIEAVGTPGRRDWKVLIMRRSMTPFVIDDSMVDPHDFMEVLERYRPAPQHQTQRP